MTAPRLVRRDAGGGRTEWKVPDPAVDPSEDEAPKPTSRRIAFELPDGYMATISLVPYTEQPAEEPATEGQAEA